ncbi:3-oxoacyl-[acyl-carrier-protein] synthase III C-terminal domain-containing protein [Pendulispora albinea]|uniref:Naringenin-chalcone synthase n=1 Tax=Pendulispora albinea TaxID=2741071 RepID=A0ABZ2LV67_9BACT
MARPTYETRQSDTLAWLASAHVASETALRGLEGAEREVLRRHIEKLIDRCACRADRIARRGSSIADVTSTDWSSREIYDLHQNPRGKGMGARNRRYAHTVMAYFWTEYAQEEAAPSDLIHVTCTGYASPSAAQRMVARRGWGGRTRITHAYHMGCYAAVPALRMARGFVLADDTAQEADARVDVVHTELCSLHLDPSTHTPEQFVVQSLFADGFIRYSLSAATEEPSFEVLALAETIVPDSADAMTWVMTDWGMQMTLSRDVPTRIAGALGTFVARLYDKAGLDPATYFAQTVFAVHPGGPKIIDEVGRLLELREDQIAASRGVLFDFGNMSSATLPHIWMRVLEDPAAPRGTPVVSLAFGPGLTICGSIFRKR